MEMCFRRADWAFASSAAHILKGCGARRANPQFICSTGTTHTQGAAHWVLRSAHTHKGLKIVPNCIKSPLKPLKSTDMRASVRSIAFHYSSGGWAFMEAWKMIFGLFFCIGFNSNTLFVRGAHEPGRFCATLVQPYYSEYGCQEYKTTIVDGFRLGVHRIYSRAFPSKSNRKSPIFFNYNVLTGGISWVVNSPDQADVSPAFVLADAGYDVWIGNAHTTSYSYGHEYLTELDKAYWDWRSDELVAFDLPGMMYLCTTLQTEKFISSDTLGELNAPWLL